MSQVLADIKPYITKKFMAAPCIKEQDIQAICQILLPRYKNSEVAVKAGRVITTGMEQDFFTSADIGAFWGSYDYEVTTASEDELPALYE